MHGHSHSADRAPHQGCRDGRRHGPLYAAARPEAARCSRGGERLDRVLPFISELSAVVTVSDDGGSSGRLRKELNVPPPGDIRNCIAALAEKEALLSRLFQYRFKAGEGLEGHSFGNLFLSAMTDITGDFSEAVKHASAILATRGSIFPATTSNAQLYAIMDDGSVVRGETNITASQRRITELRMAPVNAKPAPAALQAIEEADLITDGPGIALHQPGAESAGARSFQSNQELARHQGLHLQPDDPGEREPRPDGLAAHPGNLQACPPRIFRLRAGQPDAGLATMRKKYEEKQQSQIVVDAEGIAALGVKPILGDYLAEEMDPPRA